VCSTASTYWQLVTVWVFRIESPEAGSGVPRWYLQFLDRFAEVDHRLSYTYNQDTSVTDGHYSPTSRLRVHPRDVRISELLTAVTNASIACVDILSSIYFLCLTCVLLW
jgi:hypothetical protein